MPRRIQVRRSPIHGNGVFAVAALAPETPVLEYKGQRLRHDEADVIYEGNAETGHTFLFTLNDDYVIDANRGGNAARWINHSCAPNCQAFLIESREAPGTVADKVVLEALRDVAEGEELTYDYGIVLDMRYTEKLKRIWACRCGSPGCTGTMLKPKPRARA